MSLNWAHSNQEEIDRAGFEDSVNNQASFLKYFFDW